MNTKNEVAARLKALRSTLSVTQNKVAELLKCSQAKVSDYESGKLHISNSDLTTIANAYNVNLNWMLTGEGEMFNLPIVKDGYVKETLHLPILGDIAAGFPAEPTEPEQVDYLNVSTTELTLPPPYYVFTVEGESMLPFIYPGDRVVISGSWQHIKLDDRICAFRTPDGITLKQYAVDAKTKTTWLFPVNSRFHPIAYTKDMQDLTLLGVMILLVRRT